MNFIACAFIFPLRIFHVWICFNKQKFNLNFLRLFAFPDCFANITILWKFTNNFPKCLIQRIKRFLPKSNASAHLFCQHQNRQEVYQLKLENTNNHNLLIKHIYIITYIVNMFFTVILKKVSSSQFMITFHPN